MGAAISPRLNASLVEVKLYSGLNALEASWRAIFPLANIVAVRVSSVQNAVVVANMVELKIWLLPNAASERLTLASCSRTLWRLRLSRVKNVALASGLAMMAWDHMSSAIDWLKFKAVVRAWTAFSRVMLVPSWGRKPWLARVFIIGQGPRTTWMSAFWIKHVKSTKHTISVTRSSPFFNRTLCRDQAGSQSGGNNRKLHDDLKVSKVQRVKLSILNDSLDENSENVGFQKRST